jgi:hypothetical protein
MIKLFINFLSEPVYIYRPVSITGAYVILLILKSVFIYYGFILLSTLLIILPILVLDLAPDRIYVSIPLTFKVLFIAPLMEELAFRLPLRYSPKNIFIAFGTLLFLFMNIRFNVYISLFFGTLIALIPALNIISQNSLEQIKYYFFKYYKFIFYFLSLSFGMLHLYTFTNLNILQLGIAPLFVINQIFMGLFLSFTRVKYEHGFFYCVVIHILINMIFIFLAN